MMHESKLVRSLLFGGLGLAAMFVAAYYSPPEGTELTERVDSKVYLLDAWRNDTVVKKSCKPESNSSLVYYHLHTNECYPATNFDPMRHYWLVAAVIVYAVWAFAFIAMVVSAEAREAQLAAVSPWNMQLAVHAMKSLAPEENVIKSSSAADFVSKMLAGALIVFTFMLFLFYVASFVDGRRFSAEPVPVHVANVEAVRLANLYSVRIDGIVRVGEELNRSCHVEYFGRLTEREWDTLFNGGQPLVHYEPTSTFMPCSLHINFLGTQYHWRNWLRGFYAWLFLLAICLVTAYNRKAISMSTYTNA